MSHHVDTFRGKDETSLATMLTGIALDCSLYGATFLDPAPALQNYWFGKTSVQLYTYLCTLVVGGSKTKEPLTVVDPSLVPVLNAQKYFSYSLGDVYTSQEEHVTQALNIRQVGTFLFAPVYNLQKATARPRIWSLSFVPIRDHNIWSMHAQAVMGHCTVWPMLPYELLGAVAICQLMVGRTGLKLTGLQWMFHTLSIPDKWPDGWKIPPDLDKEAPSKLPSSAVASALLSAEAKLRKEPSVRPALRVPVDAYGTKYLDDLQRAYLARPKEPVNDKPNP